MHLMALGAPWQYAPAARRGCLTPCFPTPQRYSVLPDPSACRTAADLHKRHTRSQWPNREPSGRRAQTQFRGLSVGNTRVATDARISSRSAAFQPLPNEKPTPTPTEVLRASLYYSSCNPILVLRVYPQLLADTPSASARSARNAHKDLIYATPRRTQRQNHPLVPARVLREHRRCVREALHQGRPDRTRAPPGNDLAEPVTQPRIHVPARRATALRH